MNAALGVPQRLRDPHGRYYTDEKIGDLVVNGFDKTEPSNILDLGSGSGVLTIAAKKKWGEADVLSVDLHDEEMSCNLGVDSYLQANILDLNFVLSLESQGKVFDVAICNPPYTFPDWRPEFEEILEMANLGGALPVSERVPLVVLFIAQNIRLLRKGGEAAIIVPDGVISSESYKKFRSLLSSSVNITKIVKLPEGSFRRTEAQAHVIYFKKKSEGRQDVFFQKASPDELLSIKVRRNVFKSLASWDFDRADFFLNKKSDNNIGSLNVEVFRGNIENSKAKEIGLKIFHTTDFPDRSGGSVRFCLARKINREKIRTAKKGDILLARVGRNLFKKVAVVASGESAISDCVIVIRAKEKDRKKILEALSVDGNGFVRSLSRGVGAKFITVNDVLAIPV